MFGTVVGYLLVVEWQKRGLPHVHILIIVANEDRPVTAEDIDEVICAELPPDPDTLPNDKKEQASRLQEIIIKNMIHGPFGDLYPQCPCMSDENAPKDFQKNSFQQQESTQTPHTQSTREEVHRMEGVQ